MDISDKKTVLDDSASIYQRREEKTDRAKWKELKGFEKVFLEAGESKNVEFILSKEDFAHFDVEKKAFVTKEMIEEIEEKTGYDILGIQEEVSEGKCIASGKDAKYIALIAKTY